MARHLEESGYQDFLLAFFDRMFVDGSDQELKARIVQRSQKLPAATGSALLASLAGWDAAQLRTALEAVRVPLMAIQSTTMGTDRLRVPLSAGQDAPWLDLLRAHVPAARIEMLLGYGHFPHVEASEEVSALLVDFVRSL